MNINHNSNPLVGVLLLATIGLIYSPAQAGFFTDEDYVTYNPNKYGYALRPDGSMGTCYEVYGSHKDIEGTCQVYATAREKAYSECMNRRITGNETRVGLVAIKDRCWDTGHSSGRKAVKWYLRKGKIKGFFN